MKEWLPAYLTSKTLVMLDTSSLASAAFPAFFARIEQLRSCHPATLIILGRIYNVELPHLALSSKPDSAYAQKALQLLKRGVQMGAVRILDDDASYPNADSCFLALITASITKYDFLVVTEDKALAQSVSRLDFSCVKGAGSVRAVHFAANGSGIELFYPYPLTPPEEALAFPIALPHNEGAAPMPSRPLQALRPHAGELFLSAQNAYIQLNSQLSPGVFSVAGRGQTAVFPAMLSTGVVLKLDRLRRRLARALDGIPAESKLLLLPDDLIVNGGGQVIGYLTQAAPGYISLDEYLKVPHSEKDRKILGMAILYAASFSHRLGLVLGGLDPAAILVQPQTLSVKLGACWQWQVEDQAATPRLPALAADGAAFQLLPYTADAKPLAKLCVRLLSGKSTYDPNAIPQADPELQQALRQAIGGTAYSARYLRNAVRSSPMGKAAEPSHPSSSVYYGICANPNCRRAGSLVELVPGSRYCKDCYKSDGETHYCKDCGRPFRLTHKESDFYTKRGLELPVRCPSCRAARAQQNKQISLSVPPIDIAPL